MKWVVIVLAAIAALFFGFGWWVDRFAASEPKKLSAVIPFGIGLLIGAIDMLIGVIWAGCVLWDR
jgi:F0F1-type ATP synthase assembly protein I